MTNSSYKIDTCYSLAFDDQKLNDSCHGKSHHCKQVIKFSECCANSMKYTGFTTTLEKLFKKYSNDLSKKTGKIIQSNPYCVKIRVDYFFYNLF